MNTPHTPGPWSCERFPSSADDHDLIVYRVWSDSADKMVCICKAQTVHKCQANAHLIASAPTLLSQRNELRQVLNDIEQMLTTAKPIDYKRDCIKAFQMAQAALART